MIQDNLPESDEDPDKDLSIQQKALDELEDILDQIFEPEMEENVPKFIGPQRLEEIWNSDIDIGEVSFMGNDWKLDIPKDSPLQPKQIEQVKSDLIANVQFGKLLGSGAFGRVHEVTAQVPTNDVEEEEWPTVRLACKVIRQKSETYHSVDKSLQEMKILRYLRHPNICNFKEIIGIKDTFTGFPYSVVCLFFELCDGDLRSLRIEGPSLYTGNYRRLSEKLNKYWFIQIVRALEYIHSEGVVHLDLNERNILYKISPVLSQNSNFEQMFMSSIFKLTDFGLSKSYPVWTGEQDTIISLRWDCQKDIQALAKTVYLAAFGIPFNKYAEIYFNRQDWDNVSPAMKQLVFNMTNDTINWSASHILQDEWLQDNDVLQWPQHLLQMNLLPND